MFASEARGEILQRVCQNASAFIGIHIDNLNVNALFGEHEADPMAL